MRDESSQIVCYNINTFWNIETVCFNNKADPDIDTPTTSYQLPESKYLCFSVSIMLQNKRVHGSVRLLLSYERNWKDTLLSTQKVKLVSSIFLRVFNRFFGIRDTGSQSKMGRDLGLKVCTEGGMLKITIGVTGLRGNLGRD